VEEAGGSKQGKVKKKGEKRKEKREKPVKNVLRQVTG